MCVCMQNRGEEETASYSLKLQTASSNLARRGCCAMVPCPRCLCSVRTFSRSAPPCPSPTPCPNCNSHVDGWSCPHHSHPAPKPNHGRQEQGQRYEGLQRTSQGSQVQSPQSHTGKCAIHHLSPRAPACIICGLKAIICISRCSHSVSPSAWNLGMPSCRWPPLHRSHG